MLVSILEWLEAIAAGDSELTLDMAPERAMLRLLPEHGVRLLTVADEVDPLIAIAAKVAMEASKANEASPALGSPVVASAREILWT